MIDRSYTYTSLLLLCASAAPAYATPVLHEYRIEVSDDLTEMHVQARFAEPVMRMAARDRNADDFLRRAENCTNGERLRTRGRRLNLPDAGVLCVDYVIDLEDAAAGDRRNRYLTAANVSVSPSKWLWRPAVDETAEIRVDFDLPEGVRVAIPWKPLDAAGTQFLIQSSPESSHAPAVIGRFGYYELDVAGATLRVALPDAEPSVDRDTVLRWLRATATDVSLTYGRFPNPSPFVIVTPIASERRWSNSAVPFGRVIRDGGETVELFVDQTRPLADYLGDWTATHEFSHLMVPYLNSEARWISEGFAQYYQNVLLARSGAYDQELAWQKIVSGLRSRCCVAARVVAEPGRRPRSARRTYEGVLERCRPCANGRRRIAGTFRRRGIAGHRAGPSAGLLPAIRSGLDRTRVLWSARYAARRADLRSTVRTIRRRGRLSRPES